MSAALFLLPAFAACLLLTGIHSYLGLHVIRREIIFVDIALAQLASLGISVAFLLGYEADSLPVYLFAGFATTLGAAFFSFFRDERLSPEAVIGVVFAVASAFGILIADRIPHGAEHLKYVLNGNILWVSWPQLAKTFVLYSALGIFHWRFRKVFWEISSDKNFPGRNRFWDFLFYASFGLVITSSVQIGGVLVVFAFLIVPALLSQVFFKGIGRQLLLAWFVGLIVSLIGISASYAWDLPTGAAIVAAFGLAFAAVLLFRRIPIRTNNI